MKYSAIWLLLAMLMWVGAPIHGAPTRAEKKLPVQNKYPARQTFLLYRESAHSLAGQFNTKSDVHPKKKQFVFTSHLKFDRHNSAISNLTVSACYTQSQPPRLISATFSGKRRGIHSFSGTITQKKDAFIIKQKNSSTSETIEPHTHYVFLPLLPQLAPRLLPQKGTIYHVTLLPPIDMAYFSSDNIQPKRSLILQRLKANTKGEYIITLQTDYSRPLGVFEYNAKNELIYASRFSDRFKLFTTRSALGQHLFITGGIYTQKTSDNKYTLLKVLAVNEGHFAIKIYATKFDKKPTASSIKSLTLGGIKHPLGAGIAHLNIHELDIDIKNFTFLGRRDLTQKEHRSLKDASK